VVYGVPALAAGISKGVRAQARCAPSDQISLNRRMLPSEHELYRALGALRSVCGFAPAALELDVELPLGAGLGSSASMAVASARALASLHHRELMEQRLFDAAQAWEGVFHGNPSGVDVAAARAEGLIEFR